MKTERSLHLRARVVFGSGIDLSLYGHFWGQGGSTRRVWPNAVGLPENRRRVDDFVFHYSLVEGVLPPPPPPLLPQQAKCMVSLYSRMSDDPPVHAFTVVPQQHYSSISSSNTGIISFGLVRFFVLFL